MTSVVVFAPDLMDRSRFDPLKAAEGVDLKFASGLDLLAQAAGDIGIADLGRPGAAEALAGAGYDRKLGFASHVDADAKDHAASLGIEVFNRSVFFSRVVAQLAHA